MINTKLCSKCHIEKPTNDYLKDNRTKSGFKSACKLCTRKQMYGYKICQNCNMNRSLKQFKKHVSIDGLESRSSICNTCVYEKIRNEIRLDNLMLMFNLTYPQLVSYIKIILIDTKNNKKIDIQEELQKILKRAKKHE